MTAEIDTEGLDPGIARQLREIIKGKGKNNLVKTKPGKKFVGLDLPLISPLLVFLLS